MTKENIFKSFLEDPLLVEKEYITPEKPSNIKLIDSTGIKLIEVIKIAVSSSVEGDNEGAIVRKINQYLNM